MKSETILQTRICMFIDENYPDTLYTSSIAGLKLPPYLGSTLSQAGYRKGTPDLLIFEARKGYHALFIEVKTETGKPSKEQLEFAVQLMKRGYYHNFCYGYEQAIKTITNYFN